MIELGNSLLITNYALNELFSIFSGIQSKFKISDSEEKSVCRVYILSTSPVTWNSHDDLPGYFFQ